MVQIHYALSRRRLARRYNDAGDLRIAPSGARIFYSGMRLLVRQCAAGRWRVLARSARATIRYGSGAEAKHIPFYQPVPPVDALPLGRYTSARRSAYFRILADIMTARTILVVEDDPQLRLLIARSLKEHGYGVLTASTGAEMRVALQNGKVDLVVLDIMLPGTSGIELLRRLRAESNLPVIFISARGDEADRVIGLELGADDYLAKPFGTRELIARIAAVLRRHESASDVSQDRRDEAVFSDWRLSFSRRELRSPSDALVDLTTAEFDLLSVFLQEPQRAISRERLIELSRTRTGDASDRSVDVLVSRLRRKLSLEGREAPITTVRGVGYMFRADVSLI